MAILVGVDGTGGDFNPGAARDARYDTAFAHSFVRRICNAGGGNALYQRGPVALGGGLPEAINAGMGHILSRRRANPSEPILLTGYSRGGLGAVVIAKRLKDQNIPVQAMLLFDCVDRHLAFDGDTIPDNVGHVLHVIRHPDSSSRESFGNDGMKYFPKKTKYEPIARFMCTHGGMGGCPWEIPAGASSGDFINEGMGAGGYDGATTITYAQDARVSAEVWTHCLPFMRQYRFGV
jgi:hypothetical protein